MPFLTTSTTTLSCLVSAAPQADSWWLGHVEPDDVVIGDIGGQALHIFLHGPESAHNNGIPIHPCTLLKKKKERAKRSTDQTWCLRLLVLFLSNVVVDDGQEAYWHLLLMTAPRRRPSRLGTVLTEICRCVQQIFQHRPATMPFLITSTITLSGLASIVQNLFLFYCFGVSLFFFSFLGGGAGGGIFFFFFLFSLLFFFFSLSFFSFLVSFCICFWFFFFFFFFWGGGGHFVCLAFV